MRYPLNPRTRQRAHQAIDAAPDGFFFLPPAEPTRKLALNAKMWAMLNDVARQLRWPVNGVEEQLSAEAWKDIFTASLNQEQRMAAGLRGGFVMLGESTSGMSQRKMGDLIELMYAWGANNGVQWSEQIEIPGWVR
ncbi:recombination protein NinB [Achromobacter xylosoxidans]|uniref:NinB protein n=1 Tax=Alcaligenes xylosoxydans xylosoxydans TaxID=85698 RepID=A0A1R1JSK7_ALCXX|nr:recombination protein NinB [Achromobacter xylosoxidans]OMG85410.1 hypothetical protein BIZ92_27065 [Achromobacter xylosoxidans]